MRSRVLLSACPVKVVQHAGVLRKLRCKVRGLPAQPVEGPPLYVLHARNRLYSNEHLAERLIDRGALAAFRPSLRVVSYAIRDTMGAWHPPNMSKELTTRTEVTKDTAQLVRSRALYTNQGSRQ
jgi:hypothetical protein